MTGRRGLSLLLWAVALHSALVGIGLMAAPPALLERFGFGTVSQRFFPVQGGVFHLVMVMFYVTAARAPERHRDLVRLAVATTVAPVSTWVSTSPRRSISSRCRTRRRRQRRRPRRRRPPRCLTRPVSRSPKSRFQA